MDPAHVALLLDRLRQERLTLALAESCTGGLLGGTITAVAGSSDVFLGGIVAYSDEAKRKILGVPAGTIESHGAVSDPVAREMARQARALFRASCGLSVTGIAGPTGATPGKPVGLVLVAACIGRGMEERVEARRFLFGGDREAVRRQSVGAALALLEDVLAAGPA